MMASTEHQYLGRAASEAVFKHDRLANNNTQIRLLRIQGRLGFDEIRCSLEHFYLDSLPPYVALSYRWNTTSDRLPIRIGSHMFDAVPNAWLALQYLGLQAGAYIWVDSICIDQSNVDERNTQVGLMSRIYSTATEVYVWLGLQTEQSEIAFEALQSAVRFETHKTDRKSMEKYCSALQQLFGNEYWTRTWIVQEIIFAQKITIASGQLRVTWDFLETFLTGVLPRWKSSWSQFSKSRQTAAVAAVEHASVNVLVRSRNDYREQRKDRNRCRNSQLFEFLQSHRNSKCLDPRDKIYGLLGLFNEIAITSMSIDYSKTVEEMLMIALSYTLEGQGAPRVLPVAELFGSLLGVKVTETVFQTWLRPRLRFRPEGNYFQCLLGPDETHTLSISANTCSAMCYVPSKRFLDLQGASTEQIQFWMDPFGQQRRRATAMAKWLWRNQVALCAMIKNAPTSACLALKQTGLYEGPWSTVSGPGGGRYPRAVVDSMTRAYSDGAPLSTCNSPKAFIDEQGNAGIICSEACPGDIVCSIIPPSQTSTRSSSSSIKITSLPIGSEGQSYAWEPLDCVLRPSKTGYEVIGSAFMLQRAVLDFDALEDAQRPRRFERESEYSEPGWEIFHMYLDPLNALAFSASFGKLAGWRRLM